MADKTAKKNAPATKKPSRVTTVRTKAVSKAIVGKEKVAVVAVTKQASGFLEFLRNQGIVGLAVGLAIGTAAGATVKTIVEGFITPIVQLLAGTHKNLEAATWHVEVWGRPADFKWGAALSSTITLIATAFVIYLIVHFGRLDRLDKKKE